MFWDRFAALCVKAGKSPNGVAKELGIPSGSITAWKNGSTPRNATIIKIASYFNVEVSVLTGEFVQKEKPLAASEGLSETKIEFIEAVKQMSDDRILQLMYVLGLKEKDLTK